MTSAGKAMTSADRDALNHHERHRAPIDLPRRHRRHARAGHAVDIRLSRRDRAQIEQRKSERRVHERRLHVHPEHHAEPDEVDTEPLRRRPEQGDHDEGDLEEVEKEGEKENEDIDEDEKADHPAGQRNQQLLDPSVTIHAVEGEREHARADQDEDHESRELGGDLRRLPRQIPGQPPLDQREDQRAAWRPWLRLRSGWPAR